jgi:hypothetical protein
MSDQLSQRGEGACRGLSREMRKLSRERKKEVRWAFKRDSVLKGCAHFISCERAMTSATHCNETENQQELIMRIELVRPGIH